MQIGIHSAYDCFNKKNSLFQDSAYEIGDDLGYPFVFLKKQLSDRDISIDTLDMHPLNKYEKIIFLDLPDRSEISLAELSSQGTDLYLIILESEIIKKDNWQRENHRYFDKVFTWHDGWVDNKKYVNLKLANRIRTDVFGDLTDKEKLCTLISSNKVSDDGRELYSERVKSIEWFEENHPVDFDLYGIDWEFGFFSGAWKKLNRFSKLRKVIGKNYQTYKGRVDSKIATLSKYRFSICYENVKNIPGYITEKIFDSFFAGCVPIYWGAPNIAEYVPGNCFVDRTNFDNHAELYDFMSQISDKKYAEYQHNIREFIKSDAIRPFSAEHFCETIMNEIVDNSAL